MKRRSPVAVQSLPGSGGRFLRRSWVVAVVVFVMLLVYAPPAAAAAFPDVPVTHPYAEAIYGMRDAGVIAGYKAGSFGPADLVVRQQSAKMVVLNLGLAPLPAEQCPFGDVDLDWPYPRGFVAAAAQHGITTGTSGTTFSPWDDISRAQVVTMVVRALQNLRSGVLTTPPLDYTGTLAAFDATHGPNLRMAEYNGLLEGLEAFAVGWDPWQKATRGEVAQLLWNARRLDEESDVGRFSPLFAAGGHHSLCIKSDGSLWAWGSNGSGQLGDGTTQEQHVPVPIGSDTDWVAVSAGGWHSLAIKEDGSLWAWGSNNAGRLGDGTANDRHAPTRIGADTDWKLVAAGTYHSLAIKEDGSLWAWGPNLYATLGDGTKTDRWEPVRIGTDTDWKAISAGTYHSLAIKEDGSLWAGGYNQTHQFGDGTNVERLVPMRTGTDMDWKAVSAGLLYSLGLKNDGTLWAWGGNTHGQLGDGSTTWRAAPVRIGSGHDWAMAVAGDRQSFALRRDGSLWAWGYNAAGQVGDGTVIDRTQPVAVTDGL